MNNVRLMLCCLLIATQAWAGEARDTTPTETRIGKTATADARMTENDRLALRQWKITPDEYRRYQTLMHGIRGSFSVPNISPLEVLGIHARTPEERRRYADRWVRVLYQDTERVLAFEREVQAAWRRLGVPMFDDAGTDSAPDLAPDNLARSLRGRRLAVFTSTRDCAACREKIQWLLSQIDQLPGLDLYITDTDEPDAIRAYAKDLGIPPQLVQSKRITLNRGGGLFLLYRGDKTLPALFVRSGARLLPLNGRTAMAGAATGAVR